MKWLLVISSFIGLYIAHETFSLLYNYWQVRNSPFPIIISPLNQNNALVEIFAGVFRPLMRRKLPTWMYNIIKAQIYGWEFVEKGDLHEILGPVFLTVSPARADIWIADPDMGLEVLNRRTDFVQFGRANMILGVYGPNLLTSDGDHWQRQRRLVTPNLNERISNTVWEESTQQASDMLKSFSNDPVVSGTDFVLGLKQLAMHVLGRSAYGQPQPWTRQQLPSQPGKKIRFIDSITILAHNYLVAALVPSWFLRLPFFPAWIHMIAEAKDQFPDRTKELLQVERDLLATEKEPRHNIVSGLVQASDAEEQYFGGEKIRTTSNLSEEELQGNLYLLSLAGMDTTANALAMSVLLLALHPELQDWLHEEVQHVFEGNPVTESVYNKSFPNLSRHLAFMVSLLASSFPVNRPQSTCPNTLQQYEVLRLYPLIVHIARGVRNPTVTLSSDAGTVTVPQSTLIYVNTYRAHTDPKVWGKDANEFKPSRWLSDGSKLEWSSMIQPPKGSYFPWSGGRKFTSHQSQVTLKICLIPAITHRRQLDTLADTSFHLSEDLPGSEDVPS